MGTGGASAAVERVQKAKVCPGPVALENLDDGKPNTAAHGFARVGPARPGQLIYYFQAVDRFRHLADRETHLSALKFVNLSKCAGLQGMFGSFLGMRVRLTKKVLSPELVQEATGEIVGLPLPSPG